MEASSGPPDGRCGPGATRGTSTYHSRSAAPVLWPPPAGTGRGQRSVTAALTTAGVVSPSTRTCVLSSSSLRCSSRAASNCWRSTRSWSSTSALNALFAPPAHTSSPTVSAAHYRPAHMRASAHCKKTGGARAPAPDPDSSASSRASASAARFSKAATSPCVNAELMIASTESAGKVMMRWGPQWCVQPLAKAAHRRAEQPMKAMRVQPTSSARALGAVKLFIFTAIWVLRCASRFTRQRDSHLPVATTDALSPPLQQRRSVDSRYSCHFSSAAVTVAILCLVRLARLSVGLSCATVGPCSALVLPGPYAVLEVSKGRARQRWL